MAKRTARAPKPKPKKKAARRRLPKPKLSPFSDDMLTRIGYQLLGAYFGDMLYSMIQRGKSGNVKKDAGLCAGRPEDYLS